MVSCYSYHNFDRKFALCSTTAKSPCVHAHVLACDRLDEVMDDDGYDIYGGAPAGGGGLAGMVAGLPTGGGYDDSGAAAGADAPGGYDAGAAPAPSAASVRGALQGDQRVDSVASLVMEEILEKLKMLDYEEHFKSFRPLTHTYFAMANANPNEQFYYFTSLVSWLLSLLGQEWKAPSQLDDPNSAVASLYAMLQQIGAPTTFGAMKLKSGCGEAVCSVLKQYATQGSNDRLADATDRPATHAFEPHLGQSARPHPDRVPPARLRRGGCL